MKFQSTLPVWGATRVQRIRPETRAISIHAPRVGSDGAGGNPGDESRNFNPRSPCGERLGQAVSSCNTAGFQSTLPVWGATPLPVLARPGRPDFNPRSPCGERQQRCTDFSFASSAKRVFFCDILQIGRHLQGIGRKRRGDFLSRSVRTSRGKYGCLAFAFRESGGLRENRRFYSQSVLFSFRIDCQGSRILGCPFRGP